MSCYQRLFKVRRLRLERLKMKIGVTGTRNGMNNIQSDCVNEYLAGLAAVYQLELHHGDCVGVDAEAAEIANCRNIKIVCHPPEKDDLRAFYPFFRELREPKSHFARNRAIVDECDILIVVPMDNEPQKLGGTWYTHDYAKKKNKPIVIFYPDGRIA